MVAANLQINYLNSIIIVEGAYIHIYIYIHQESNIFLDINLLI